MICCGVIFTGGLWISTYDDAEGCQESLKTSLRQYGAITSYISFWSDFWQEIIPSLRSEVGEVKEAVLCKVNFT